MVKYYLAALLCSWTLSGIFAHLAYYLYPTGKNYVEPEVFYNGVMYTLFIVGIFCLIRLMCLAAKRDGGVIE